MAHTDHLLFHQGFLQYAVRKPTNTAVIDGSLRLTYDSLLLRALRTGSIVHRMAGSSPRPVAVLGDKGHLAIEAILASLLTGRPYCFLNPAQRLPRLQRMVDVLRPALVIDTGSIESDHSADGVARGIPILRLPSEIPGTSFEPMLSPSGAAYVLFTSGSTGEPKGVAVGHKAAAAAQRAFLGAIKLGENDIVASEAPLNFDVSVFDILASLSVGASIALISDSETDPQAVLKLFEDNAVTSVFTVPSLVLQILESAPAAVARLARMRKILMTGELISARLGGLMNGLVDAGCELWNLYGATEFPWGLSRQLVATDLSQPNILEKAGSGAPVVAELLESGELWVRGDGLSSGYVRSDTDYLAPFLPLSQFATGDFAENVSGNILRLLGRRDRQIRRDGYRIELREIENWIETHPLVDSCFAKYRQEENDLTVYVSTRYKSPHLVTEVEIVAHAQSVLPEYMLPNRYVLLETTPRTISGKKDYFHLPK